MQETGFICFPSYACKKSPCPSFSHQHLPFICLCNCPFSALPALKASEKLQCSQAALRLRGKGGRAQPAPPE